MIKGGIEYTNDLRAFVVDNSVELLVPQHRDCKSDYDVTSSGKWEGNRHTFHHSSDQRVSKDL